MPVIVFASPKGGAGKSTSAVLLATELAGKGAPVALIDADPNRPLTRWASRPGKPASLEVISDVAEDTITDTIDRASAHFTFVVVDLEGTASMMVGYAMSRADLVVIPTQGSFLDAAEAVKAIKLLRVQERAFRRRIPAAILFTRTSAAIRPRTLTNIEQQFEASDVPVFRVHLHERDAYKALFVFGGSLSGLDPAEVRNIPSAAVNARAFAQEVLSMLKAQASAAA